MSKAKITAKDGFSCAPEGHTIVVFDQGDIVTGQVADWAVKANAASRMFDPVGERKVQPALEIKTPKKSRKKKAE